MATQSIQVCIKNVYGNELIYPVCEKAKIFAQLARKKTLDTYDLKLIKALGYAVSVVPAYELKLE